MQSSGDSAEKIVAMGLEGTKVILSITGVATKNLAVALVAMSKEQKNSKGKTNLSKMLKTGKECKVFSISEEDLKVFNEQSKAYGVLYCALVNKKDNNKDGLIDIMVKGEDASKVNRIITRFELAKVDKATIKSEVVKDMEEIQKGKEVNKDNPKSLGTAKDSQSRTSSNYKRNLEETSNNKESVKEKIKDFKEVADKRDKYKTLSNDKVLNSSSINKPKLKEKGR